MADYDYENIKIEKEDGITWFILNRPEKRNAMSPQLHYEADDALEKLQTDPDTKVLVLTGAGDEAFCAGQDLKLYFRGTADDPVERAKAAHASNSWRWRRLSTFPRPTIAMVNGYCFGGAFTPVCACDFAIAAEDAQFGLSEINWGILPGGIVSWNVADVMSYRDAIYYAVTGDIFDGKRAEEIRFINYAVPKEKLREETIKLARKLMEKNPVAVRFTKEAIRAARHMSLEQATDYLRAKSDALKAADKEGGRDEGMKQFLDDKSFRPGFEPYKRQAG
ncbi:MAG: p-hydroxycinnamoyl CoA hydratase/lyase [Proteobacteria bacterium]|nr:p-hydroxycinnamoyl CoA hydratase/lyase [Pseudomonadota bacterium]